MMELTDKGKIIPCIPLAKIYLSDSCRFENVENYVQSPFENSLAHILCSEEIPGKTKGYVFEYFILCSMIKYIKTYKVLKLQFREKPSKLKTISFEGITLESFKNKNQGLEHLRQFKNSFINPFPYNFKSIDLLMTRTSKLGK